MSIPHKGSNHCRYVEDAASIRVNAGSVGYDSYCCAGPKAKKLNVVTL